MIFQRLKNHYEFISAKLTEIEKQLSHLPPGQLNCWSVNGQSKYYLSQNHKRTYLSSKNEFLIQQLALKKYLTALQKELLAEEKALRPYIHFMQTPHSSAAKMLLPDSPLHSLLSPQLLSVSKEAKEWMQAPFDSNPYFPENLIYKTTAGIYVRSKSESLIVSLLVQYQIPFRYECLLTLDGISHYPDFTIMHPKTGLIYYWEHLGLLDKESYLKDSANKLQRFIRNGIIPTQQLIITCETKDHPLDLDYLDNLIHFYFL